MNLYELTDEIRQLEAMLEESDVDPDSFGAALEGLNVERDAKIANLGLWCKEMSANVEAIKVELDRLSARRRALENRIASVKGYMCVALDKPVKTPLVSVRRQQGREGVQISDESKIPEDYTIPQPNKIDRALIGKALKDGYEVAGAELVRGDDFVVIR